MKKINLFTLTLLLLLPVTTTHAETKEYNVEIVIFEDTSGRYINSEQWPIIHHEQNSITTDTDINKLTTLPEYESPQYQDINSVINITENTGTILAEHVSKLVKSSRYNVLLYKSWRQAGLDDDNAVNININSTKNETVDKKNTLTIQTVTTLDSNPPTATESTVSGNIKLILGRYLHIHTDLLYKRLNKKNSPTSPKLHVNSFNEFEIKSQRRMRSRELHYIDHPLLGILTLVSPVKTPETAEEK